MQNFMRVASMTDDSVMFLNDETAIGKEGKRVIVELAGLATVAIAFVPAILLKEIEN